MNGQKYPLTGCCICHELISSEDLNGNYVGIVKTTLVEIKEFLKLGMHSEITNIPISYVRTRHGHHFIDISVHSDPDKKCLFIFEELNSCTIDNGKLVYFDQEDGNF